MDTRRKLQEARHFLTMLKATEQDRDEFDYYLDAFVLAWRSVLDIMLYDAAEIFSLNLSREQHIADYEFLLVARAFKHTKAQAFIEWWHERAQGSLSQNPLWSKRTIVSHRGFLGKTHIIYGLTSGGISGTFVTVGGYFHTLGSGSGVTIGSGSNVQPYLTHIVTSSSVFVAPSTYGITPSGGSGPASLTGSRRAVAYFEDFPGKNVVDICEEAISQMEAIVEEAEETFNIGF